MAKWPWRPRSMPPIFNNSCENPKMHIWCKFSSWNPLKVIMAKMTLTIKVNDLHFQYQLSIPECMFGANLVILAQLYDELLCGQAEFPRTLSQNGQNDLEGQGQWPLFSIPTESIPCCMFGANLVIPAQICEELSCRQSKVYGQTDGPMDGQTEATTIPLLPESLIMM